MKRMTLHQRILAMLLVCVVAGGCGKTNKSASGKTDKPADAKSGAPEGGGGHSEKGPNGGKLFELVGGDHIHGEVVHDEKAETVTFYVVDESGKKNMPIDAKEVVVNFKAHDKAYQAKLKAMPMDGEKDGMSSRFVTGKDHDGEELVEHFDDEKLGAQVVVTIKKTPYRGKIPTGGGEKHDHEKEKTKTN